MNILTYKDFFARIEFDAEDELFVGRLAGIHDVIGFHADTVAGLRPAFEEAVDDYLEACAKIGKRPEKPYSGKMMLRVDPSLHARAARAAELAGKSLNAWGVETLAKALG